MLLIQTEVDGESTVITNDLREFCKNLRRGIYMVVYAGGFICNCALDSAKSREISDLILKSKSSVVGFPICGSEDGLIYRDEEVVEVLGKNFFNPKNLRADTKKVGPIPEEDILSTVARMKTFD